MWYLVLKNVLKLLSTNLVNYEAAQEQYGLCVNIILWCVCTRTSKWHLLKDMLAKLISNPTQ